LRATGEGLKRLLPHAWTDDPAIVAQLAEEAADTLVEEAIEWLIGAHFTCFTSTKVQILTPEELQRPLWAQCLRRTRA